MMKIAALGLCMLGLALANPTTFTAEEAAQKHKEGHIEIIVDIRSHSEYAEGHIKGAINLPMHLAQDHLKGCEDSKIAIHCFHGDDRASPFAKRLAQAGFTAVLDIGGYKHLQAHFETTVGAWDGALPACSHKSPKREYVQGEVQLNGIQTLNQLNQANFRKVLAAGAGSNCGDNGDTQCSETDVTIVTVTGGARRSSQIVVSWSMETKIGASAESLMQAVTQHIEVGDFASQLAGSDASLSAVVVATVTAPSRSTEAPETPPNTHSNSHANPQTNSDKNQHGVYMVASQDVDEKVHAGDFDVIIDVRSAAEFAAGHIPGAIHMPHSKHKAVLDALEGCKGARVGVYCWTGFDRATPMAQYMASQGFTDVYDLGGLQFMDGIVLEQGPWDGALPTCATSSISPEQALAMGKALADQSHTESSSETSDCTVLILIAVAVVALMIGVGCAAFVMQGRTAGDDDQVVAGATTTAYPAEIDLEKAKAQASYPGQPALFNGCGEHRSCGMEKPVDGVVVSQAVTPLK